MQTKNKYEVMVVIKPSLPENVVMGVESKIIETLELQDGKVTKTDKWGKRHLAYRINRFIEGNYIVYEFENSPEVIKDIEKILKLNKEILRYLLINQTK